MKLARGILIFSGFLLHSVFADSALDLSDSDFESSVSEYDTSLVMFYAPWCGHCKKLKPEFEKAAKTLLTEDPPVTLAKVDCTEAGKDTCNKFGVSGYPTLKIFRNGEMSKEYNGPRDASGIVKYMKSQVGPSSKDLATLEALELFISKDDVAVVGFFQTETDLKGKFIQLANKLREKVNFGHSTSAPVLDKYNYKNNVVLYRPKHLSNKFEPDFIDYNGEESTSALESWINSNYHGLVGHRQKENMEAFKPPYVGVYYAVDYGKNPKGTNYWRNRVLKVAKSVKGVSMAINNKDDFQHEINEHGLDFVSDDKPIVLARSLDNKKYIMKDDFSVENLEKFINDFQNGNLEPYIKSEPIPEDNSSPVKVAVAKNFDDIVINNGVDTLVEFYAPWCGHCKSLAPVYEQVAEKLKDEAVSLVKMDATANDVPPLFDVRGFPTLYWLPKDSKTKPIRYEGGRDVNDFIKYISTKATNELKNFDRSGNVKDIKNEL
ncbi:protein disulfide-isomerase A3 [Daktulosphaira vitifoliae]|uniref:protein disulfide-isomerase A3 n=1 Tax=Daktulosphaira vitifoliae TaxID=58002 RepID=UPI0021AA29ED|nr:protein disulfide-isomerase A3 [Daktulosphaira vitifoliae]XP_050538935.1 protein disulfide-isomerase A3 [Daktulosphaira vitifoliae]